ncbi:hypothetical protein N9917_04070 [Deltaproteobacteria bacterium]|nr:hypothetical protein [Deltaproteobacteria bacterium]
MKILNIEQGSEDWLEMRLNHCTASEAPAMMGVSPYMTRNQLLDLKKGWQSNPDSSFKQELFRKGHANEEAARQLAEDYLFESLVPAVGVLTVDGVELLASFDGLGSIPWENKSPNVTLTENVRNGVLEAKYYWQLEQQALVFNSDSVLFSVSDGSEENTVFMEYKSLKERREQLVNGWKQFVADLETHELQAKAEAVQAVEENNLPVLLAKVDNGVVAGNMKETLAAVKALSVSEMSKKLETDQDFANKDMFNKNVKKARERLKQITAEVREGFSSYSEFEIQANDMDKVLQQMQSYGEKQVKHAKQAKKDSIVGKACTELASLVVQWEEKSHPARVSQVCNSHADFDTAMKNKRSLEGIQNAVDTELARVKIIINETMGKVVENIAYMDENQEENKFLFRDIVQICNQEPEAFKAVVKMRVMEHEAAELKRLEVEREKIRIQEEQKAKAKVEAEKQAEADKLREDERLANEVKKQEEAEKAKAEHNNRIPQIQQEVAPPEKDSVFKQGDFAPTDKDMEAFEAQEDDLQSFPKDGTKFTVLIPTIVSWQPYSAQYIKKQKLPADSGRWIDEQGKLVQLTADCQTV